MIDRAAGAAEAVGTTAAREVEPTADCDDAVIVGTVGAAEAAEAVGTTAAREVELTTGCSCEDDAAIV